DGGSSGGSGVGWPGRSRDWRRSSVISGGPPAGVPAARPAGGRKLDGNGGRPGVTSPGENPPTRTRGALGACGPSGGINIPLALKRLVVGRGGQAGASG